MINEVPAHLEVFIEVLGEDAAERVFLELGGAQVYVPNLRCTPRSNLGRILGTDRALELGHALGYGYIKVPVASAWIARRMHKRGVSKNEIARTVRTDVATVRRWLSD